MLAFSNEKYDRIEIASNHFNCHALAAVELTPNSRALRTVLRVYTFDLRSAKLSGFFTFHGN